MKVVVIARIAALACLFLVSIEGSPKLFNYNCGIVPGMGPRIENGNNAREGSHPWMALVFLENKHNCSGTLITSRFVLTAAHCIIKEYMKVRLGEHDLTNTKNTNAIERDVDMKIVHKDYNYQRNDIGLLRMKTEVNFTAYIIPICLLYKYPVGAVSNFSIAGWGTNAKRVRQPILQEANVQLFNRSICVNSFFSDDNMSQICSGDIGIDSCEGDSGGPLSATVVNENSNKELIYQIGIISYGLPSCSGLGLYTNVTDFSEWILRAPVREWQSTLQVNAGVKSSSGVLSAALAVRRSLRANFLPQIADGDGKEPPTIPKQRQQKQQQQQQQQWKTNTGKSEKSNNNCILVAPYQMAVGKGYTWKKSFH
ncbi:serine protease grass-like [Drosophila rhopaloa]|uniref:Peptidase S1 domain-containing protein n=1 Tax=Drosophila rhopaloa TaxID=1041015 RepID=A0ABM5J269_DRORH|nr:serine protease grass-like [Drosophila rhopaloa]